MNAPLEEVAREERGSKPRPTVLLIGNPNVGKTTLFNALSGQSARVGNYPGITVERRTGITEIATGEVNLVDIPGVYSLAARSADEAIAVSSILGEFDERAPDAAIVVIDAGQLSRCLYLALEVIELRIPTVIALNMIDESPLSEEAQTRLQEELGVPLVATSGRAHTGFDALKRALSVCLSAPQHPRFSVRYPSPVQKSVDAFALQHLESPERSRKLRSVEAKRALATFYLLSLGDGDELDSVGPGLRTSALELRSQHEDFDLAVISARYRAIDELVDGIISPTERQRHSKTDRVDRFLLHPLGGTLAFLASMTLLFQSLFSWSEPLISLLESFMARVAGGIESILAPSLLRDFLVQGALAGVGNVLVFLPQILLLFLFVGVLEDSGYMARVAYLVDRFMRLLGLNGRAFVPMLSGYACAVPAIMSTRTMERKSDRLLTMLVIPLTTCSARLPVYTLILATLLADESVLGISVAAWVLLALYLLGALMALFVAWLLGRTLVRPERIPLLLELPPYRLPDAKSLLRDLREKASGFVRDAGGIILGATVVLWLLLSFPRDYSVPTPEGGQRPPNSTEILEGSYGAQLARSLDPLAEPLGFDWRITTGIIGAFSAREVFVSTMGLIFSVEDADEESPPLRERIRRAKNAKGEPAYTPLQGLSLLVFFAFACQCMSTLSVIYRETKSLKWPIVVFSYMTVLAYLSSLTVYQCGKWLGF